METVGCFSRNSVRAMTAKRFMGRNARLPMLEGFGAGREVRADSATRRPRLTDIVLCAPGFESDDDGQEFSSHRSDLQSRCPVLLPKSPASTATCWRVSPTKRTTHGVVLVIEPD